MSKLRTTLTGALTAALAISLVAAAPADARRGGSFGSRGYRTYSAPRPTSTAPGYTAPVQRSMTSPGGYQPAGPSYMPGAGGFAPRRPGFGSGLVTGLVTGGLIGGLMGHGFGGGWGYGGGMGMGGGFLTILLQLLIFGLIASFVMRLFRRRTPVMAGGFASPFEAGPAPQAGPWGAGFAASSQSYSPADEIAVSSADRAAFERMLIDVQDAFAHEDYGRLRTLCTPEVMGYLAEELSDNATHGRKNEVSGTRLIRSDVSEAWREGEADYATVALNYESIDLMRDRTSGAVLSGDPNKPTSTTEVWTFVRQGGAAWKLSAIQET
jgi:predicted lipid-binding transport protein (Tim44 family)